MILGLVDTAGKRFEVEIFVQKIDKTPYREEGLLISIPYWFFSYFQPGNELDTEEFGQELSGVATGHYTEQVIAAVKGAIHEAR